MAAETKVENRLSFNPEWMETPAEVPPLLLRSSSSSNEINVPMCPPKLANFRYGREEMLALCPEKLPDIQELSDQFPDFHSAEALPPVCFQQYTEEEERLLMQGVNSSKVIAAVNHVEKASRWSSGSRGFPRGLGSTGMERSDMFAPTRERIETSRFSGGRFSSENFRERGGGRGRGGEGRGRFDEGNYVRPGRGGFENVGMRGGYEGLGKSPIGFEERNRVGKPAAESENWRSSAEPPTNARAQGLYDANEFPPERRRPKQRVLSHSTDEDETENRSQRYRTKSQSGTGIPEWAAECVSDDESGSFDASGQFKTAKEASIRNEKSEVKGSVKSADTNRPKDEQREERPAMAKSSSSSDVGKSGETAVPAKPQDYSSATTNSQQQAKLDRLESKEKQTVTKPMEEKQRDNENRFSKLNKIWDAEVKQESTVTSPAMDLKRILGLNTAIDPPSQQQQLPAKEETVADSVPRDFSGPTKRGSRVKAGGETSIPSDSSSSNSNTTEERKSTPLTAVSTATEGSRPNSLMMERTSLSASWAGVPPNLLATSANQKAAADHPSLGKTDLSASYPLGSLLSGLMSVQQKEQQQLAARDSVAGSYAVQKSQSLTSEQMRDYNPAIRRQQQKSSSPSEIEFEKLHKDMESFIDTVGNDDSQSSSYVRQTSSNSNDGDSWFYKDPQNNVQGPFSSRRMYDWFNSGYFTMNLLLRRATDRQFTPLGELINKLGKVPFVDKDSAATTPTAQPLVPVAVQSTMPKPDAIDGRNLLEELQKRQLEGLRLKQQQVNQGLASLSSSTSVSGNPSPSPLKSIWGAEVPVQNVLEQPVANNYSSNSSTVGHPSLQRLQALQQLQATERQLEQERMIREQNAALREQQLRTMELLRQQEERRKEEEIQAQVEFEQKRRAEEERLKLLRKEEEQRRLLEDLARKQTEDRRRKELEEQQRLEEEEERRKQDTERRRQEEQQRIMEYENRRQVEEEARKREELRAQERIKFEKREAERQRKAAAWASPQTNSSTISLAEVQKHEMGKENRQQQSSQQQQYQQQPTSAMWQTVAEVEKSIPTPKWQPTQLPVSPRVQSLLDIQLEEQRQMEAEQRQMAALESQKKETLKNVSMPTGGVWTNPTKQLSWKKSSSPWTVDERGENDDSGNTGFWDEPKIPVSQPMSPSKKPQNRNAPVSQQASGKEKNNHMPNLFKNPCADEFTSWCSAQIQSLNVDIDAPMLAAFLKDVESPDEVENYVVGYCGQGKAVKEFVKAFLLKRSQLKQKKIEADDLLKPATALMPFKSDPLQTVTNNGTVAAVSNTSDAKAGQQAAKKKKKTGKKLMDTSVLGFVASADPNRLNVGEIDSHM